MGPHRGWAEELLQGRLLPAWLSHHVEAQGPFPKACHAWDPAPTPPCSGHDTQGPGPAQAGMAKEWGPCGGDGDKMETGGDQDREQGRQVETGTGTQEQLVLRSRRSRAVETRRAESGAELALLWQRLLLLASRHQQRHRALAHLNGGDCLRIQSHGRPVPVQPVLVCPSNAVRTHQPQPKSLDPETRQGQDREQSGTLWTLHSTGNTPRATAQEQLGQWGSTKCCGSVPQPGQHLARGKCPEALGKAPPCPAQTLLIATRLQQRWNV